MRSTPRTYQQLSYFEKHIVKILIEEYKHDEELALKIISEYDNIFTLLNDGHETAHSFAKIFNEAYLSGTSKHAWLENITSFLMNNVPEIQEFKKFLEENNTKMNLMLEGEEEINGRKYFKLYVGENHEEHIVRWGTFYIREDLEETLVQDALTDVPVSLKDWRKQK
ncbi:hypothetical protein SMD22_21350 [Brevibacillus halotolerans]|nr:hypothetical protein SMD22_21350 [Brevibacillus halotolerans]